MNKIEKFEDLKSWQSARQLVVQCYEISEKDRFKSDFDLRSQFRRAAVSVMNNIAEGFSRFSDKEFVRFLNIAQSSASEVKSMTYILVDLGYINEIEKEHIQRNTEGTRKLILGMIKYLNNKS